MRHAAASHRAPPAGSRAAVRRRLRRAAVTGRRLAARLLVGGRGTGGSFSVAGALGSAPPVRRAAGFARSPLELFAACSSDFLPDLDLLARDRRDRSAPATARGDALRRCRCRARAGGLEVGRTADCGRDRVAGADRDDQVVAQVVADLVESVRAEREVEEQCPSAARPRLPSVDARE